MEKIAKFILFLTAACLSVGLFGCSTGSDDGSSSQKITSLKAAIDNVSAGSTIDLSSSKYSITEFGNVTINKAVTIANGDLGDAVLTVSADDVTLSNVTGSATVSTSSSMKISSSSIGSLTIGGAGASSSLIAGRGTGMCAVQFISSNVSASVTANAAASLLFENSSADKIEISRAAAGSKVTLRGVDSKINQYTVEANIALVLENGAKKPNITADGVEIKIKEYAKLSENIKVYSYPAGDNGPQQIESSDNNTYSKNIGMSDDLWNEWMVVGLDANLKENGCGVVSFSIKTDRDACFALKVYSQFCYEGNGTIISVPKKEEWTTVNVQTGLYTEGAERLYLELVADTREGDVKVELKDIAFSEIDSDDPDVPQVMVRPNSINGVLKDCSLTADKDGVLTFVSCTDTDDLNVALPVKEGKFYKVSYKITSKVGRPYLWSSMSVNGSENGKYCWAYSMPPPSLRLEAGQETTVVAYIGVAKDHWERRGIDFEEKDTDKSPYLKIWIRPGKGTFKLKDFKAEPINVSAAKDDVFFRWYNNTNYNADVVPRTFSISIPSSGKMVISGKNNEDIWTACNINGRIILSTNYLVYDESEVPDGVTIEYDRDSDALSFSSTTSANLRVEFGDDCMLHFSKQ